MWGGCFLSSYPAPFLFPPCSGLAGAAQGRDGREKAHAFTSASHAHKEGGKKKIKLLRHARMRTRAYERMLARSLAPRLIQRGITMGMCEKTEWLRSCEGTSLTLVQLRLQSPTKFYKKAKKKSCTKLDPAFVSHLDDLSLPKKKTKKNKIKS